MKYYVIFTLVKIVMCSFFKLFIDISAMRPDKWLSRFSTTICSLSFSKIDKLNFAFNEIYNTIVSLNNQTYIIETEQSSIQGNYKLQ